MSSNNETYEGARRPILVGEDGKEIHPEGRSLWYIGRLIFMRAISLIIRLTYHGGGEVTQGGIHFERYNNNVYLSEDHSGLHSDN